MNALFIVNSSRPLPSGFEGAAKRILFKWELSFEFTSAPGDAARQAKKALKAGPDVIVGVGGDGTLNEIAQVVIPAGIKLGIVPTGRSNDLAQELRIPLSITESLQIIARKRTRCIDTMLANRRFVLTSGGIGLPCSVVARSGGNSFLCSVLGRRAYLFNALAGLLGDEHKVPVTIKSGNTSANSDILSLTFHNQGLLGSCFRLAPGANNSDSLMDVCVIKSMDSKIRSLTMLGLVLRGKHIGMPEVSVFRTRHLKVSSHAPFKFMGDGELLASAKELAVEVRPMSLSVIC